VINASTSTSSGTGRVRASAIMLVVILAGLVALATPARAAARPPSREQARAVLDWNHIAQNAITVGRPAASSELLMAIVQVAVYDAVVAIHGGARPYAAAPRVSRPASTTAAVATAAHHVLVARVPTQATSVEVAYVDALAGIPNGPGKANGIRLGAQVARTILRLRADDGFDDPAPYVQTPPGPGVFEPVAPTTPEDVKLARVRPFTFDEPWRYRPAGPTPLRSRAYARDLAEVAALGRADSTTRTPEQTAIAQFWSDNHFDQLNRGLGRLADARHLGIRDTARLLAMAHVAAADALIGCWEAKYHYRFWRPVHAIRRAGGDGNPATHPDPTWTALLTVNHPEYPSGTACYSAAITRAVAAFFDTDRVRLTLDSAVTGDRRSYSRLSEVNSEVRLARIAGGLHFRHSILDGAQLGRRVASHVTRHYFQPLRRPGDKLA
jgi:hypothetical protein